MNATTEELSLVNIIPSYSYSKLGFGYLNMLRLAEEVISHMIVWCPWATAANYVMKIALVIYWALQDRPFSLTKGSPKGNPGHDRSGLLAVFSANFIGCLFKIIVFKPMVENFSPVLRQWLQDS
ncbi:hypothetical protein DSO57_1004371 [Entomophthora muscae]|uniref:Uncharacterized protein n=1 Tax=Entomophthora muscae TaxID=34485 RepID=A0ACC2U604_9FUNG|nr:hypothetical protein DSO57_1004371 [Entomophthora muscae]